MAWHGPRLVLYLRLLQYHWHQKAMNIHVSVILLTLCWMAWQNHTDPVIMPMDMTVALQIILHANHDSSTNVLLHVIQSFFQKALARKTFAFLSTLLMLNCVQFIR